MTQDERREDMAKQMIGIASIQVCTAFPSVVAMNQAISKEHDRIRKENLYAKDTMRNRYLTVKKTFQRQIYSG